MDMKNPIFPKGEKAAAAVFTGTAYVNLLIPDKDGVYDCQVYDVVFEAGARNNWHKHPGGQLLLATDGKGYYQERGKPARFLQKGDVVTIPPGVEHWHGAAPGTGTEARSAEGSPLTSDFTHIGISPNTQKGGAEWLAPVTDVEYAEATK